MSKDIFKLLFFAVLIVTTACTNNTIDSPNNSINIIGDVDGDDELFFNLASIEGDEEDFVFPVASSKPTQTISSANFDNVIVTDTIVAKESISYDQFDAVVSIIEVSNISKTPKNNKLNSPKLLSASSPLNNGATFKVVIYDAKPDGSRGNFFSESNGVKGSLLRIPVYKDRKYFYFIYSYNNSNPIPSFSTSGIAPANPRVPVNGTASNSSTEDFCYESGQIITQNVTEADNIINVVLKRKTAAIRFVVNTQGMSGSINRVNATVPNGSTGLRKGQFNILNGKYDNTITALTGSVSPTSTTAASAWTNYTGKNSVFEVAPTNESKYHDFLTPSNDTANYSIKFDITNFSVSRERYDDITGIPAIQNGDFSSTYSFTTPLFTPLAGKRYIVHIDLIESAINIGGVKWSRGNIFRRPGPQLSGLGEYRIRYDNPSYETRDVIPKYEHFTNDIYNVSVNVKNAAGQSIPKNGNICNFIYPYDTWTIPTEANFNVLLSLAGRSFESYYSIPYYKYDPGYDIGNPGGGYRVRFFFLTSMGYKINGDSEDDGVGDPNDHKGKVYQYLPGEFTSSSYTIVNYLDGLNSTSTLRKVAGYWRTASANKLFRIRNNSYGTYEHTIITTSDSNPSTADLDETNLVPSASALYTVRCVRR